MDAAGCAQGRFAALVEFGFAKPHAQNWQDASFGQRNAIVVEILFARLQAEQKDWNGKRGFLCAQRTKNAPECLRSRG